jgi:predicted dehydrogenase
MEINSLLANLQINKCCRMKKLIPLIGLFILSTMLFFPLHAQKDDAVKVVVAGTSHGHSGWILNKLDRPEMQVIGIYEPDQKLAEKQSLRYKIPKELFFNDLNKALDQLKPEAVLAFGSIKDHLQVVEVAAPKGIHIMVEKPLAANLNDALKMQQLAKEHQVMLLTNYETSWYPSTAESFRLVRDSNFVGQIRKVVFHHGHQGPKEIGVGDEFFQWLTDPVLNGGGALMDFGCYGANLATYLLKGQEPVSVTAVTNQFKPQIYPRVDDDATIILNYPSLQVIIQASWNWTYNRKDMEIYGDSAAITALNANKMRFRNSKNGAEYEKTVTDKDIAVYTNPFSYLHAVLRGKEKLEPFGLYTLENNVMVNRILEAAKRSASSGKTVKLK